MTEQDKLDVYIDQTLQIDREDPANSQRVLDITGAWKQRASEPPAIQPDWATTVREVMSHLDLGMPENPTQATSHILAALGTLNAAVAQANQQVQSLAVREDIIRQQSNVLDAVAMLVNLPNGKLYIDMVPLLQAIVEHPQ